MLPEAKTAVVLPLDAEGAVGGGGGRVGAAVAVAAQVLGGVEVEEEDLGEEAQHDLLDDVRDGVAADAAVVDVQGHDGHGAGERNQAYGHAVVQACKDITRHLKLPIKRLCQ